MLVPINLVARMTEAAANLRALRTVYRPEQLGQLAKFPDPPLLLEFTHITDPPDVIARTGLLAELLVRFPWGHLLSHPDGLNHSSRR